MISQLQTWFGPVASRSGGLCRLTGAAILVRRCNEVSFRYSGEQAVSMTSAITTSSSLLATRFGAPFRRSVSSPARHRCKVRMLIPTTSQHFHRRAPAATASSIRVITCRRSSSRINRPRLPPRSIRVFF